MELVLTRHYAVADATLGSLLLDGDFQCFTLEDVVRKTKVYGETAIPAGRYKVEMTKSERFSDAYEKLGRGRKVPEVLNVPNYTGVRIHVGNSAKDTEGCILVGSWALGGGAWISKSEVAYKALTKKLLAATDSITLLIKDISVPIGKPTCLPPPVFDGLFGAPKPGPHR